MSNDFISNNLINHEPKVYYGEAGHLALLRNILNEGFMVEEESIGRRKLLNAILCFNLQEAFPASMVRVNSPRLSFEELWCFLRGVTNIDPYLRSKNIPFWSNHTSREFLDSRNLSNLPEGNMGKGYSHQYRNFGGEFNEKFEPDMETGVDQLQNVFDQLRENPFGGDHLISLWNPKQMAEMALPPCFWAHQFSCIQIDGQIILNIKVFSRSCEVLIGNNYQSFSIYLMAMSKALGYLPGLVTFDFTDACIYDNQVSYIEEMLDRNYSDQGYSVTITKELSSLEDLLSLTWEDIEVKNWDLVNKTPFKESRPEMVV